MRTFLASLGRVVAPLRTNAPVILRDLAGIGGVCLISVGCGAIYPPAGLIVSGILLLSGALMTARRG